MQVRLNCIIESSVPKRDNNQKDLLSALLPVHISFSFLADYQNILFCVWGSNNAVSPEFGTKNKLRITESVVHPTSSTHVLRSFFIFVFIIFFVIQNTSQRISFVLRKIRASLTVLYLQLIQHTAQGFFAIALVRREPGMQGRRAGPPRVGAGRWRGRHESKDDARGAEDDAALGARLELA